MPSTVSAVFAAAGVKPAGVVPWGTLPLLPRRSDSAATGIYVVALTDRLDRLEGVRATAPFSPTAIDELRVARDNELRLDGVLHPTREQLMERLAAFWLPDEVILYIGLAGRRRTQPSVGELAKRVGEYYGTPLGARSPHAGGWPLRTLACLDELFVHYAYCSEVDRVEAACIGHFAAHVSPAGRADLRDPVHVMPFANLEYPKRHPKDHGIRGARAPRAPRRALPPDGQRGYGVHAVARDPEDLAAVSRTLNDASHAVAPRAAVDPIAVHRSQRVTANDIQVGQVRIPIGSTKDLLPSHREGVAVVLRGRPLQARWDPRYGKDRERSGVIRVGRQAASEMLAVDDVLTVSLHNRTVHLD